MVVRENPDEGRIQGGNAAADQQQESTQIALQPPTRKSGTTPRGVKLFSNLALVGLLGVILLSLSLWMGGMRLPLLPIIPQQPTISLSSGPYYIGDVLTIQGAYFTRFSIIVLLLDDQPITDSNGLRQAIDSDSQGAFTTTLTILPTWSPGDHILAAKDTTSGEEASLDITIEKTARQRELPTAAARPNLLTGDGQQRQQIACQQSGIA